jgi:GTP-dependent phosphoenolpyruvate carboxykinase
MLKIHEENKNLNKEQLEERFRVQQAKWKAAEIEREKKWLEKFVFEDDNLF